MASVIFFRAVNVGGYQKFQPSKLVKELADLDVVNIGAAGTLIVRKSASRSKLRDEILSRLPFTPELMICSASEVLALAEGDWFKEPQSGEDLSRFVSVMQKASRNPPPLPVEQPPGKNWEVRIVAIKSRFALSVQRPGRTYSNAVIEKHLGVSATTRNWNTIEAICRILKA